MHFLVPSTGYGKGASNVSGKHINDYIGGTAAGGGRMLAFLRRGPNTPGANIESNRGHRPAPGTTNPPDIILTICENPETCPRRRMKRQSTLRPPTKILAFAFGTLMLAACAYGDAEPARILSSAPGDQTAQWFIASITRITD